MSSNIIQSLWVGSELSSMEQLSILSFLAHDHEVHVYTYDMNLKGVPEGAVVKNAEDIVPKVDIDRFQNLANFSDYFRFSMLYKMGGWWADLDSICLRHFDFPAEYVFSNYDDGAIGAANIKAPAKSDIMKWLVDEINKKNLKTIGFSEIGPFLLAAAVAHFKYQHFVQTQDTFIPIGCNINPLGVITDPIANRKFGPETYAVHLYNYMWGKQNKDKDAAWPPSCIYEQLKRTYLNKPEPLRNDPKVSIIITCYNYGQYLAQAIESALAQTYYNIEVIVVDDESTDDSVQVAESFGDKIKLIKQKHSGAPATGRNTGFENSDGDLILSLDADDWLEPNYLERTIPHMKGNLGVVGVHICGWPLSGVTHPTLKQLLVGNCIAQTALIRRQAVIDAGGWNPNLPWQGYEDWNFWICVMKAGWEIEVLKENLYHYRQHGPSLCTSALAHHSENLAAIKRLHPTLYTAMEVADGPQPKPAPPNFGKVGRAGSRQKARSSPPPTPSVHDHILNKSALRRRQPGNGRIRPR